MKESSSNLCVGSRASSDYIIARALARRGSSCSSWNVFTGIKKNHY